ncbi:MAG: type II secretion system F family protein [Dehalococcoidia bacterium]|nr:type II secretion system F family protein [Dehalococcoidia bacterium]
MAYKYVAYTSKGELAEGVMDAETEESAEEALWTSDLTIVELRRIRPGLTLEEMLPSLFAVKKREIIVFSQQMATLLSSGIAVLPALRLLKEESSKRQLAKVLGQVVDTIQQGPSLSEAFAKHPDVFPVLFIRLIEVGEQTGNLEAVLRRLAEYMEKEEHLIGKVRGALIYPSVIIVLAVMVALLFVNFVLPGISGIFTEFKSELPLATRILLSVSAVIRANFVQIVLGLALLAGGLVWYVRTEAGRKRFDYLMMTKVPVVKGVVSKGCMARLASMLAMLLAAGLPLTETMELLLRTTENRALQEALGKVRTDVLGGISMSAALSLQPIFPPLLGQMVKVGEETGTLAENLMTLARYYEDETDRAVATLTSLIEPTLILAVGGFIAFLAISIITPMYSILKVIK